MTQVYRIDRIQEYRKAGPTDLIELLPAPNRNQLYLPKWLLEVLTSAVCRHQCIHISGPTGSAKSSLLEALNHRQDNFRRLCEACGFPPLPLHLHAIEMATFETPGELYLRRALRDGTTFDEPSRLVHALEAAVATQGQAYPLIWLREMGRVRSASVQGGLLDLVTKGEIILPDGRRIDGHGIAWVADSNYQAEQDSTHTLVTFDDALRRRFAVNLTLDHLSAQQEAEVLRRLHPSAAARSLTPQEAELVDKVVKLGLLIRSQRAEGNLQTVVPPTIYGYLAFLDMARSLPHLSPQQVAVVTLLGNAGSEDRNAVQVILNQVWGIQAAAAEGATGVQNLF